jgi:hypothetical protein
MLQKFKPVGVPERPSDLRETSEDRVLGAFDGHEIDSVQSFSIFIE